MLARDTNARVELVRAGTKMPDRRAQFDHLRTGAENEQDLFPSGFTSIDLRCRWGPGTPGQSSEAFQRRRQA